MGSISNPSGGDSRVAVAGKSSQEIVNNSDVYQNDDDLVLPVEANERALVFIVLRPNTPSGTPDLKWQFTVPAAAEYHVINCGLIGAAATGGVVTAVSTEKTGIGISDIDALDILFLVYIGGANAGNIQFQWAQNLATAEDTKMRAGSSMIKIKVS